MKHLFARWLILSLVIPGLMGCGGRLPPPERAKNIMQRYFKSYGKKYKTTEFGKNQVTEIDILETSEIHKFLAQVTAFVSLSNNDVVKIRFTLQKKPFGWRALSWENLLAQTDATANPSPELSP